jgi:superoxide reductase
MNINSYEDISLIEREAKKDYIDRHSAFIHCPGKATRMEKFKVNVKIGNLYKHPDDFDHYISWIQLWDSNRMLADITFPPGVQGNAPAQVEVDFYVVPARSLKLTALVYCTKHGLWKSDEKDVEVTE